MARQVNGTVNSNMATLTLFALAIFAGAACSVPQASRIIGGDAITIDRVPSIVQVESMGTASGIWSQTCAATILTSRYVLSAAHCFHGINYNPRNRRIRAGTTYLSSGGVVANVDVEYNHPTYGLIDMDGDISVVRLQSPLEFSSDIQPSFILAQGFVIPDAMPVSIVGWGATELGGPHSDELLEATVYTVNRELCAELYATLPIPRNVTENMICAGVDEGGLSACNGDYGGPLFYDDYLIGILSWGQGCDGSYFPGVSTAVSSYTDWIVGIAV